MDLLPSAVGSALVPRPHALTPHICAMRPSLTSGVYSVMSA